MKKIILRKTKEKAIKNRHHWIFSGAVSEAPSFTAGEILPVYSFEGEMLGSAYFNPKAQIVGRMLTFNACDPKEEVQRLISRALLFRQEWFINQHTNAYRLINGEGDGLPGLIVDQYADVLVLQCSTKGMEALKPLVVECLQQELKPKAIFEKSNLPSRKEEGLEDYQGFIYGEAPEENISILENGLKYEVSILNGQKTGFFLDHREMRKLIGAHAKDKRVLNAFSYTGGFSVAALAGGALHVDSVDISAQATALAKVNTELNGFSSDQCNFITEDVFQYLREQPLDYTLMILDPPAFAKKKKDIVAGCRGYKDINRLALKKMPPKSMLLTCSCSYHVDEELFQKVVFQAAMEAGRFVRIIDRHHQAADHPINICHPESDYLKSLLLYVE